MMNWKVLIFAQWILIFTACNEVRDSKKRTFVTRLPQEDISPLVDSLVYAYIKEVPSAPAYAIFIDKKSEGRSDFMITLAPFSFKLKRLEESGALNYFAVNDSIMFFIYTGLEDFILYSDVDKDKLIGHPPAEGEFRHLESIKRKVKFSQAWSYIHTDTISYVVKGNPHPFTNIVLNPVLNLDVPKR